MQIIAPNGSVKLILYYKGYFADCQIGGHSFQLPEHRLFVTGVSDCPSFAEFERDEPFGCISIELNPAAAYRLLAVPQHELRNTVVPIGEIIGTSAARILEERMYLESNPANKTALLQEYLTGVLIGTE
ncbi:hypothetical protein E5161_03760 [Cohnella pontilimi]|uniref:AraC family transcriptional regulator n=1 Tax=Cohnella pontilimi TaxID=2564100 RepID=A0A4U0FHP5_9BACL|nr:hypothetical protein [Cohnella pontilimi]TJY44505.1 hypothetical protein E5161_03760 [Cohnella pontilimi]